MKDSEMNMPEEFEGIEAISSPAMVDLPEEERERLLRGIADAIAGRVFTDEEFKAALEAQDQALGRKPSDEPSTPGPAE